MKEKYKTDRVYRSVELPKGKDSDEFKQFLKDSAIKYEPSEAWNMIHFEVLVDEYEENECNKYLENPERYWAEKDYFERYGQLISETM